jgi:hypothetical protein
MLLGEEREAYSQLVSSAAEQGEQAMREDWQMLFGELNARGWSEWSYHFAWSQVMDSGFAWSMMMERRWVPPLSQLIEWVVYPAHSFKTGTNYFPDDELRDQMLAVTWRPESANTIGRVGGEWRVVLPAALRGTATADERPHLESLGFIGPDGRVNVPVVRASDPLYASLRDLAEQHVQAIVEHLPLTELQRLTAADEKMTVAMAYHDASWEVLRRMVDRGSLIVPAGLEQGASDDVSMVGVCAVVDTHPAFLAELKNALGIE